MKFIFNTLFLNVRRVVYLHIDINEQVSFLKNASIATHSILQPNKYYLITNSSKRGFCLFHRNIVVKVNETYCYFSRECNTITKITVLIKCYEKKL